MGTDEMDAIADLMSRALDARADPPALSAIRAEVRALTSRFPLYPNRLHAAEA
jgi:glycine/serine hydroxymethyltransferase